jgi:hypothetical protein
MPWQRLRPPPLLPMVPKISPLLSPMGITRRCDSPLEYRILGKEVLMPVLQRAKHAFPKAVFLPTVLLGV